MEIFVKANQNPSENFPCNLCYLIFKNEHTLNEHTVEIHSNIEGNNETESEAVSTVEISDVNSEKLSKSDDKVFHCNNYNFKSSSEHGIQIHKTKKHIHVCQFCYKKITNSVEKSNHVSECSSNTPYASPTYIPVQMRGQFPPRFPTRFPYRFPHSPMW